MNGEHTCTFVEEREPSGRLIVGPCLGCTKPAFSALADAQATVEALTKERDKAVTRCAHLDILLRDEYLPKLDVEAVKRSIADRDHRIDELEREIEQLDDTVEALQKENRELSKLSQLQALVRALVCTMGYVVDGSYILTRGGVVLYACSSSISAERLGALLAYRATLDATATERRKG